MNWKSLLTLLNWKSRLKFIYSERATKFCIISALDLTVLHTATSKVEISQNFVAFSKYMNFNILKICIGNVSGKDVLKYIRPFFRTVAFSSGIKYRIVSYLMRCQRCVKWGDSKKRRSRAVGTEAGAWGGGVAQ